MAAPTVAGTNSSIDTADVTTVDLPASIASGDLLICWFECDQTRSITDWDDFTELFLKSKSGNHTLWAAYRIADGTAGATIIVTINASERSAHQTFRITGWHGTTPPEVGIAPAAETSEFPDPPSLAPSWGAEDTTLWMLGLGIDTGNTTVDSYPTNYTNGVRNNNGGGGPGANLATCRRELNASPEDPGTFDLSTSDGVLVNTLAIRPAAAVVGSFPPIQPWINRLPHLRM